MRRSKATIQSQRDQLRRKLNKALKDRSDFRGVIVKLLGQRAELEKRIKELEAASPYIIPAPWWKRFFS